VGRLVIFRDSERLAEHDLSRGVIGLGRHPENDIVLDDRTLSRFHAKIMRQGGGDAARWVVVDLGAQNGVHLNGERISNEVQLQPGDRIELGRYTAVFEQPAPPAARSANGRPAAGRAVAAAPPPAAASAPAAAPAAPAPAAAKAGAGPPLAARAPAPPAPKPVVPPAPSARPSAVDDLDLDLDEDLSIGDDLDVDLELGDGKPAAGGLAAELDLDDVGALEEHTNTSTNTNSAGGLTNARDDGMTAELAGVLGDDLDDDLGGDLDGELGGDLDDDLGGDLGAELDDEVDDDSNEVSHAAFVAPKPTFVLLFNGLEVSRHPLEASELTIGRSKQCDIVISLLGLSRKHARMTVHDEGVVVEDLGSQNGTWVNNQRIEGRHVLRHGDLLNFYDYGVLFLEDGDVDVGLPGAAFSPSPTSGDSVNRDDLSARETDRALPPPAKAASPAAAARAPVPATRAAAPAAPAAKAAPAPVAAPVAAGKAVPRPPLAEPSAALVDDDDDLGLGQRASSLEEETEFGRQRPGSKRAGDDRFELDELGDGSFLGDEFEDGASKDRAQGAKPAGGRQGTGVVASDLSRAGDDEDLEAAIAFDNAAKLGDNDEFGDLNTDGQVHGLADRTSAGIDVASLNGGAPGAWPSDDELDRALAQTNDTAAVTIDVTMKGKSFAQIPLSQAVTRAGTDPRCECALPKSSGLRPWHMTFLQMGGAVVVTRANRSARIDLGGKDIDVATLRNGDILRIGAIEMKLRFRR
jgi:pSer/pThr/pTyr-binding forkhead associated (FHA) protein